MSDHLCRRSNDIVVLQETWLVDSETEFLSTISEDFYSNGISSVNTSVQALSGRPYGGLGILWRKSLGEKCNILQLRDNRMLGIEFTCKDNVEICFVNMYMPYDCSIETKTSYLKHIPVHIYASLVSTLILMFSEVVVVCLILVHI